MFCVVAAKAQYKMGHRRSMAMVCSSPIAMKDFEKDMERLLPIRFGMELPLELLLIDLRLKTEKDYSIRSGLPPPRVAQGYLESFHSPGS